jgi:hypothetical protein
LEKTTYKRSSSHVGGANEESCDDGSTIVGIPLVVRIIAVDVQVAVASIAVQNEIPEQAVCVKNIIYTTTP